MGGSPDVSNDAPQSQATLERYRSYLRFLAEIKLDRRLRDRVDPSDIVQETLLRAHGAWNTFRGSEEGQRLAWLRQILMRTILHAFRDARRAKRDVTREQPLGRLLDQSSVKIEHWLAADEASPSGAAQRAEELLQVAEALEQLSEPQRSAVVGYYWQGHTLAELGAELGRSAPAVAGLVHRGLRRLREQLAPRVVEVAGRQVECE